MLSPNDRHSKTVRRLAQFVHQGVRMAWLIDPEDRTVTVLCAGQLPTVVEEDEERSSGDALPDFRCKGGDLFYVPGG